MASETRIEDLAIFGGTPAFAEKLHVGCPNIGNRARLFERIDDMLDRRWLTNHGPYVEEFEQRMAALLGVRHFVAMCNGTIALEIVTRALDMRGEVIIPSFTFIATAHALQWQGITPVFCDVAPGTHHIDPAQVERLITPRTTGIIPVHVWGEACDIAALQDVAGRHGLRVVYDAAHALACSYGGAMIGNFGDAEVFSFHATKFFNTFEGGAVTTNDDGLAESLRFMRNFGFAGIDDVDHVGTNGKMTEVCAAMGLTSLEGLDEFVGINLRNYRAYHHALGDVPGLAVFTYDEREKRNFQYIVVEVDETVTGITRDAVVDILHAENVLARRYFCPGCHRMEPYRSCYPDAGRLLPQTERLAQRVMSLPTGTALDECDVAAVCGLVRFAVENSGAIAERLLDERAD
jgi:dTDP-4-amino-4,6-dideoxygalactose transaminase